MYSPTMMDPQGGPAASPMAQAFAQRGQGGPGPRMASPFPAFGGGGALGGGGILSMLQQPNLLASLQARFPQLAARFGLGGAAPAQGNTGIVPPAMGGSFAPPAFGMGNMTGRPRLY